MSVAAMNGTNQAVQTLPIDPEKTEWHGRVVLGYLMRCQEGCDRFSHLSPELFTTDQLRRVFQAIGEVRSAKQDVNLISVCSALEASGDLVAVGGRPAVTSIYTEEYGTPKTVEYAIGELTEARVQRRVAVIGQRLIAGDLSIVHAAAELQIISGDFCPEYRVPRIRFFQPSELRDYKPEKDVALVGDCHIMRGEVFVIGGEPGVGKSRGATALAVAGATGRDWFGLPVHRQFRTMIVQAENGRHRLQQEFAAMRCDELDSWIRVSEPPPFGLTLTNAEFQQDIRAVLEEFKPECVILDPWNAVTRDDKQRDYADTFEALRNLLPTGADKPALGIVAHTRKPTANDKRTGGTGLMHNISGSHMLVSLPRSVFVMVRGSEDESDDTIVWCNPKNNNGALAARTAWHRNKGRFDLADDFDWKEFDKAPEKRVIVDLEHLAEVFINGDRELGDAAHALASIADINKRSAYNALKPDGKFKDHLLRKGEVLSFLP